MKRFLLLTLLTGSGWAHPLSWLAGTYHGVHDGATLEESWTDTGSELLGTSVWLEDGRVGMRELFRIRPQKGGYHLDLWLTFSDGLGKHLQMDGRLEAPQKLVFRKPGESLTFRLGPGKKLTIQLHKKELRVFHLEPGPTSLPQARMAVPEGEYILHTYLGDHVFADELKWGSGNSGTLTVPGKFASQIENMELLPQFGVSFEIMVPEGKEPYRVRYRMHFNADLSQATGTLVQVSNGKTIGSFVAVKRD